MATYELYLGGASTANADRGMYPSPTFAAANAVIKAMRPTDHKNQFLNRVLDFTEEKSLTRFMSNQATNGVPVTTADILGLIVLPQNIVVRGYFYEVERVSNAGLTFTPKLRVANIAQSVIAGSALSKGFAPVGAAAAWVTANGALPTGQFALVTPDMLDLTITAIGSGFGGLRLNIGVFFDDTTSGQH